MNAKVLFWLLVIAGMILIFGFALTPSPQGMHALIAGNVLVLLAMLVGVIARAASSTYPADDDPVAEEFYDEDDEKKDADPAEPDRPARAADSPAIRVAAPAPAAKKRRDR